MMWFGQHPWVFGTLLVSVPVVSVAYAVASRRRWGAVALLFAVVPAAFLIGMAVDLPGWEHKLSCFSKNPPSGAGCEFDKAAFELLWAAWIAMSALAVIMATVRKKPDAPVHK